MEGREGRQTRLPAVLAQAWMRVGITAPSAPPQPKPRCGAGCGRRRAPLDPRRERGVEGSSCGVTRAGGHFEPLLRHDGGRRWLSFNNLTVHLAPGLETHNARFDTRLEMVRRLGFQPV
jgi:hypothetical protein